MDSERREHTGNTAKPYLVTAGSNLPAETSARDSKTAQTESCDGFPDAAPPIKSAMRGLAIAAPVALALWTIIGLTLRMLTR
jgi:hypothetical protein